MSSPRVRTREPDAACAGAVDLARCAAEEVAGPDRVGQHVGADTESDRIVTHLFECLDPAYEGWRWGVTVVRAARAKVVTVSESVLLPGPDSLLAPEWVPWRDRVRPGDLGVGDLLPTRGDDERLVPAVALAGDDGVTDWDEGAGPAETGRARELSAIGRDTAAARWYSSEHGPSTPLAHAAPGPCLTCGFMVRLSGPLGQAFGVCANEYAPDDGRVVSTDHGCGAHSEATMPPGSRGALSPVIDELGYDLVDTPGVSMDETVFESLDHG